MVGRVPGWRRMMARHLRREPTRAEKALWRLMKEMRRQRLAHFRRQVPIGPFIVDFAELGQKLIVEADGGQHGSAEDKRRDGWLEGEGFTVIRLWNNEILSNPDGVWRLLSGALAECGTPTPTLPPRGRELAPRSKRSASPPPRGEGTGVGDSDPSKPSRRNGQ